MFFYRIKELRKERGLTCKQVAQELGIAPSTYARYEKGLVAIPVRHVLALRKLYDVSAEYLLGRSDDKTPFFSHPNE